MCGATVRQHHTINSHFHITGRRRVTMSTILDRFAWHSSTRLYVCRVFAGDRRNLFVLQRKGTSKSLACYCVEHSRLCKLIVETVYVCASFCCCYSYRFCLTVSCTCLVEYNLPSPSLDRYDIAPCLTRYWFAPALSGVCFVRK